MVLDGDALAARPKVAGSTEDKKVTFGRSLKSLFLMAEGFTNLNNGSFGTIPRAIQNKYEYGNRLDESRKAIAEYINAPLEGTVFVANATTGVNVVLRNLAAAWRCERSDRVDEILCFSTVYHSCGKTIDYIADTSAGRVAGRDLHLSYPCADEAVVETLRKGIQASRAEGRVPRVALFDVVSALPGVCVPWKALVRLCREEGVLSVVDGAHGVGMVSVDVAAGDPDFFVSNCHKWMHVPRGCAVFYAREDLRHLLTSTVPTSYGYEPLGQRGRFNPLPEDGGKTKWFRSFEFMGTTDNAPFLCVKDSIAWRKEVLGGEDNVLGYIQNLARDGGKKVAERLGTEVMENEAETLTRCAMVNVALPVVVKGVEEEHPGRGFGDAAVATLKDEEEARLAVEWVLRTLMSKYDTFVPVYVYRKRGWARLSAQVFLDMDDFEWIGSVLGEICDVIAKGKWKA